MLRKLENQYLYLLSCINLDGYNLPKSQSDMTKKELISCLKEIAKKEIQTNVLTQKTIENWLRGLSCCNIEFWDYKISDLLVSWNIKPTQKNIENYWNVMSYRLLQMFNALDNNKKSWFYDK